jgi:hypothetical protein
MQQHQERPRPLAAEEEVEEGTKRKDGGSKTMRIEEPQEQTSQGGATSSQGPSGSVFGKATPMTRRLGKRAAKDQEQGSSRSEETE